MVNDYYTFSELMKKENGAVTASMEDYIEMIYRLSINTGFTRIHELSHALNIQPPSATRMAQKLATLHLLKYEKYGVLILEEEGKRLGSELLRRHQIIEDFIRMIGVDSAKLLDEAEKIEHTLSRETTRCFENFVDFCKQNPDIQSRYLTFLRIRQR